MARSTPHDERAEEAVECFLCLSDPDAEPRVRARWSAWLSADPENQAAYHRVREAWSRPVPGDVWPTHAELLADSYDGEGSLPAAGLDGKTRFSTATVSLGVVAALLLVAVVGASLFERAAPPVAARQSYRTERGEQRRIALPDGSAIALGPSSALSLEGGGAGDGAGGTARGRAARLEAGEAVFSIVHDPAHPFTLAANGGRIDDIGTVFGVRVGAGRATVTVVEGAVRVATEAGAQSIELSRDQQVSFARRLEPARTVDGRAATDWVRGRLVYVDRPLGEVAVDLMRYTTVDIDIADPSVAALHTEGARRWPVRPSICRKHPGTRLSVRSSRSSMRIRRRRSFGRLFGRSI